MYRLSSLRALNSKVHVREFAALRFEPWAAGWKVRMFLVCNETPDTFEAKESTDITNMLSAINLSYSNKFDDFQNEC